MHSRQEKNDALEHIAYEIDMLDFLYAKLVCITNENLPPRTSHDKHLEDTFLDAFVIHAENMFHFYYGMDCDGGSKNEQKKHSNYFKSDDIFIQNFIFNTDLSYFKKKRISKDDILKIANISKKRNKQVAHLTWSRVRVFNNIDKYWPWNDIYKKLKHNQEVFIEILSHDTKNLLLKQINRMKDSCYYLPQITTHGRGCTGPSPAP